MLKSPIRQPGLITQTLEITTEQTLQEDHVSMEQIDPKILEEVIAELRADPDLKDTFLEIEQQFQEGIDMDIDIGMDTRLEDELNWEIW